MPLHQRLERRFLLPPYEPFQQFTVRDFIGRPRSDQFPNMPKDDPRPCGCHVRDSSIGYIGKSSTELEARTSVILSAIS
jgi:hypothetical protein